MLEEVRRLQAEVNSLRSENSQLKVGYDTSSSSSSSFSSSSSYSTSSLLLLCSPATSLGFTIFGEIM